MGEWDNPADAAAWANMAAMNAGGSAQATAAAAENLAHNLGNVIIPGQLGREAATAYEKTAQQYPGIASQLEAAASRAAAERAATQQAQQQAANIQRLTTIQSAQRPPTQYGIQEQFSYALQNASWLPASYVQPLLQAAVGAGVPDTWKLVAASPALSEIAGLSYGRLEKTNFGGYGIAPSPESTQRYVSEVVAPAAKKAAIIESIVPGVAMTEEQKKAIGYYGPYTGELISVTEPEKKQEPAGKTYYVPFGERTQTEIKDVSAVRYGKSGEVGFYQSLYTPEGNLRNITNLVSSGGPAALQSGMFSEKPLTVDVRTQDQPEKYAASAVPAYAEMVKASPESFSRLGAEAYGGYVLPLESVRTIEATGAQTSTYPEVTKNLASLVSPQGANLPRSEYVSLPRGGSVPPESGVKMVGTEGAPTTPSTNFNEVVFKTPTLISAERYDITPKTTPGNIFEQAWQFFQPGREVTKSESVVNLPESKIKTGETITPLAGGLLKTEYYTITGGKQVSTTTTEKTTPSQFDLWYQGANKAVSRALGLDMLAIPSTEETKRSAPLFMGTSMTAPFAVALQTPGISDYAAAYLRGEARGIIEQPLTAASSFGLGAVTAGVFKGAEAAVQAGKVATAEKVISEGGGYRAADIFATTVMENAPKALGAIYATDIAARSTDKGRDLSPSSAERFGVIAATEARPMIFGAMTPGAVYEAARLSDIGYKSALQEGMTTGRLQYYITEPTSRPFNLAKIDYAAYAQESGKPGLLSYVGEKVGMNAPVTPEIARSITPPESEFATGVVYGKQPTFADFLGVGKTPTPEISRPAVQPESEFATGSVYGKQPTVFSTIVDTSLRSARLAEIGAKSFVQEAPGKATAAIRYVRATPINIRSYFQETRPFENLLIGLKYPAAEISRYNALNAQFAEKYGGASAQARQPITPLSKTFGFQTDSPKAHTPTEPLKPFTEISGPSGQISVLETPSSVSEPISRVTETGWRGVPEFPVIPSPISRQRYRIEEETQYLTIPPGMERPSGASAMRTVQFITPVEVSGQRQSIETRQEQARRSGEIAQFERIKTPVYDIGRTQISEITPASITKVTPIQTTKQSSSQTPQQRIEFRQSIIPVTTPWIEQIPRVEQTPTFKPQIRLTTFGRFGGPGAGGGATGSPKGGRFGLFTERYNVGQGIDQSTFLYNGSPLSRSRSGIDFGRK